MSASQTHTDTHNIEIARENRLESLYGNKYIDIASHYYHITISIIDANEMN